MAISISAGMSVIWPARWTGTIALVFLVIFASIWLTSMQKLSVQSTKTGRANSSPIAPTVAMKVLAVVMTSSPGPTPSAFSAELDRVGARVHADGMARADHGRELLLEFAHRLAEREVAGRHELAEQVEDLLDILGAELLGQIGPLNLVAIGLRRQVDARHPVKILISDWR